MDPSTSPSVATTSSGEFWAIVSDEKTTLQTFQEYGLRFDIEENFLDDQSNGWNVQHSEIRPGIRPISLVVYLGCGDAR